MNYTEKGSFISVCDGNCEEIRVGDRIKVFDQTGTVVFECGAFGIAFDDYVDWDRLEREIEAITGCKNRPDFCYHDYFVSFWELLWNYNCEQDICCVAEIVKGE